MALMNECRLSRGLAAQQMVLRGDGIAMRQLRHHLIGDIRQQA